MCIPGNLNMTKLTSTIHLSLTIVDPPSANYRNHQLGVVCVATLGEDGERGRENLESIEEFLASQAWSSQTLKSGRASTDS